MKSFNFGKTIGIYLQLPQYKICLLKLCFKKTHDFYLCITPQNQALHAPNFFLQIAQKVITSHNLETRSSHLRCSVKKGVLKTFANFLGKHLFLGLFLIKLQALDLQLYWKLTPAQVFSCKIFKKTYFEEHLRTTASNWLELMTETLSFLKWLISKRHPFISFNISENPRENQNT